MTSVFTDSAIQAPSKGMQIDTEKLRVYLLNEGREFFERGDEELLAHQFVHGQSNPTYLISIGRKKFVLRKQPPGLLLNGAHDVLREATIIDHLSSYDDIPVAKIYCMCSDSSIVGTPFYIMEHVKGIVYTDPALPSLSPQQRTAVYEAASRVLAAIHSVQACLYLLMMMFLEITRNILDDCNIHNDHLLSNNLADRGKCFRASRQRPQL
jgi:acyl-CoA dehydrogenase